MSLQYKEEFTPEEQKTHTRRGCCIAIFLLPILCFCIGWPVMSFTTGGRIATAHTMLYLSYYGFPGSAEATGGFPDAARAGCALDRQNPRPQDYQRSQDLLEVRYLRNVRAYRFFWNDLKENGGDTSEYESPSNIPPDFQGGKRHYCR